MISFIDTDILSCRTPVKKAFSTVLCNYDSDSKSPVEILQDMPDERQGQGSSLDVNKVQIKDLNFKDGQFSPMSTKNQAKTLVVKKQAVMKNVKPLDLSQHIKAAYKAGQFSRDSRLKA